MYVDVWARKLTFGKHEGKRLGEVPRQYLKWILAEVDGLTGDERRAVQSELNGQGTPPPPPRGFAPKLPVDVSCAACLEIIQAGLRALSKQYHPDLETGDAAKMYGLTASAAYMETQIRALQSGGARR